ncbi:MAG: hypothetical protein ACKO17_05785 [Bacteroidota bacterium]
MKFFDFWFQAGWRNRSVLGWMVFALVVWGFWVYRSVPDQGLSRLDDSIFIEDFYDFNRSEGALVQCLERGVFRAKGDNYYRPALMMTFVMDAQWHRLRLDGYYRTNLGLHVLAMLLLFGAMGALGFTPAQSWFWAMLFGVLPVLSQAVAWIPGRNDTLLGVAAFGVILAMERSLKTGRWFWWFVFGLTALVAVLTKETGLLVVPAAACLILGRQRAGHVPLRWGLVFLIWLMTLGLWWWGRTLAQTVNTGLDPSTMFSLFGYRIPMLLQYLGKTFFPWNLSVFPLMEDTDWMGGSVAVLMLVVLLGVGGYRRLGWAWMGSLGFWFLLLLPALVVPRGLNDQAFEHRLYVPTLGILVALASVPLPRFMVQKRAQAMVFLLSLGVLYMINVRHRSVFADEKVFWRNAADNAPSSAYAQVMYAVRCLSGDEATQAGMGVARPYILKAYALDSNEKYVSHYRGLLALEEKRWAEASGLFEREFKRTGLADSYFHNARALFELGNKAGAARMLTLYLEKKPGDPIATNNLKLLQAELSQSIRVP